MVVSAKLKPHAQDQARSPGLLARWQWFWIPPLYALAMIFLVMITLTQSGGAGQLMYRGF
jgi:lipopolysaccharide export LptBFGC system permease protein LptF